MIPQLNNKNETRKADINFTVCYPVPAAQRFALPALGRGRRSRPTRKMIRRRKLLEICTDSPASGARFVGQPACLPEHQLKKDNTANLTKVLHTTLILTRTQKL